VCLLHAEKFGPDPPTLPRPVWAHPKPTYKLVRDAHNDDTQTDFSNVVSLTRIRDVQHKVVQSQLQITIMRTLYFTERSGEKRTILRIRCGVLLTFIFYDWIPFLTELRKKIGNKTACF